MTAKRFRRILAEQRVIVVGEAPEFDEAVLDRDLSDRNCLGIAVGEYGVDGTKALVPKVRDWPQTENLMKSAVQSPARDVQVEANFRDMDRSKAGLP